MRQEIKLRLDTKILDEAREVIKQSGGKSIEIDDVIERWCLERIEQIDNPESENISWSKIDDQICQLMKLEKVSEGPRNRLSRSFTAEEIEELYEDCIDIKIIEQGRWLNFKSGIIEIDDHSFRIEWAEGATEMQENEFEKQKCIEVFKVKKEVEVWE